MQTVFTIIFSLTLVFSCAQQGELINHNRSDLSGMSIMDEWAPFYHGVASGDPQETAVIIWTRVTPEDLGQTVEGEWMVAEDVDMDVVVQSGNFTTDASQDFTVKIDVQGLNPSTTYYYVFKTGDKFSLIGRTKTLATDSDHLKFAVVSCSNFQAGYFNAYKRISERNDLDALIHLGDYIYEYEDGNYGDEDLFEERMLNPVDEIVDLEDYRIRYSTYRLDTQLIRVHQQHPIIAVWDDHESANDSYVEGAENHTEGDEGSWEERKANARQAYFEWLPIRDNSEQKVYRSFNYGNLADLIMLDTRLEGRDEQILDIENPALYDTTRTILGDEQKTWFKDQLNNSTAKWKIIGNQVIFSEFNVGWAADTSMGQTYQSLENIFLDIWDGYPAERDEIIDFTIDNEIDNSVWLTGDFHSTFCFDVAKRPSLLPFLAGVSPDQPTYDPDTQEGSIAVEFATPSITSANFDENLGAFVAAFFESQINTVIPSIGVNPNPHLRFNDLDRHGYFILDVTEEKVQADYYFTAIDAVVEDETFEIGQFSLDGENKLNSNPDESEPKDIQDTPAPNNPPMSTSTEEKGASVKIFKVYPNPAHDAVNVYFNIGSSREGVSINLTSMEGKDLRKIELDTLTPGMYTQKIDMSNLPRGTYTITVKSRNKMISAQQFVKH